MSGKFMRLIFAALLAGVIAGCATTPGVPVAPAERRYVAAFELDGRITASEGDRIASGQLAWAHGPAGDQWTVASPLGQIVAQLVSTPRGARLLTADGRRLDGDSATSMLPALLGVSAPFDGLPHWVQASLRPGARVMLRDAIGRPARITDDGWVIEYPDYADPSPDAIPRRIDANWGDARIRLIIDQWTPHP